MPANASARHSPPPVGYDIPQWNRVSAHLRVLPDYLIAGAQRCGTTTLYHMLIKHPQVLPALTKEVHFFDNHHARGLAWYRSHFPTLWKMRRQAPNGGPRICGEATPYYLFHPAAAERIAADLPNVKAIIMLRNPVDRAHSHFQHVTRLGHEPLSFLEALRAEPKRLQGEAERLLREPGYRSTAHQFFSYVARGEYADQLGQWFRSIPRDRTLVLLLDDLAADPEGTLAKVFEFLCLKPYELKETKLRNVLSYAHMPDEVRARLTEHFAPHNARLAEMLGRQLPW